MKHLTPSEGNRPLLTTPLEAFRVMVVRARFTLLAAASMVAYASESAECALTMSAAKQVRHAVGVAVAHAAVQRSAEGLGRAGADEEEQAIRAAEPIARPERRVSSTPTVPARVGERVWVRGARAVQQPQQQAELTCAPARVAAAVPQVLPGLQLGVLLHTGARHGEPGAVRKPD